MCPAGLHTTGLPHDRQDRLKDLFRERALQFGDFTLASGKKSTYYVNSKKVLFHADAIALSAINSTRRRRISTSRRSAGWKSGRSRWPPAALTAFHRAGRTLEGLLRPQAGKEHGSQERLEGR